jgi:hypothetical protein
LHLFSGSESLFDESLHCKDLSHCFKSHFKSPFGYYERGLERILIVTRYETGRAFCRVSQKIASKANKNVFIYRRYGSRNVTRIDENSNVRENHFSVKSVISPEILPLNDDIIVRFENL